MIAVADNDEAKAAILGRLKDILGGVPPARLTGDRQTVLDRDRGNLLLTFLEIVLRRFGFRFRFPGQVRVAGKRFPYPQGSHL